MTRELCSEGWAVDKVRIINQIKPKYRKWTPGVTRTIDKDKCNRSVIDPYDYEPLQSSSDSRKDSYQIFGQDLEVSWFKKRTPQAPPNIQQQGQISPQNTLTAALT